MAQDALVVLTTCADQEAATQLADKLVESRLAACVNVISGVKSTYRWQGKVERDEEVLLLIKTTTAAFAAVGEVVHESTDYELPEFLAVPVIEGSPAYLDWLIGSVDPEKV